MRNPSNDAASSTFKKNVAKRQSRSFNESDINVYLNTPMETLYKKMIWESLYNNYATPKHQPDNKRKPPKSNKKRPAADPDAEKMNKRAKLASKINFDLLDKETANPVEEVDDEKVSHGGDEEDYRDGFEEEGNEDYGNGFEEEGEDVYGYGDYNCDQYDEDEDLS